MIVGWGAPMNMKRGGFAAIVVAMVLVGMPLSAGADPGEPPILEDVDNRVGDLVLHVQDLMLSAGTYCRTARDFSYNPVILGDIDGEILNWEEFEVSVDYCFTVSSSGSKTMTSASNGQCDGDGNGGLSYYDGCTTTSGGGPAHSSTCAWYEADGHFKNNATDVETWTPRGRAEFCV